MRSHALTHTVLSSSTRHIDSLIESKVTLRRGWSLLFTSKFCAQDPFQFADDLLVWNCLSGFIFLYHLRLFID